MNFRPLVEALRLLHGLQRRAFGQCFERLQTLGPGRGLPAD